MGLLDADIQRIAGFVKKLAKAPNVEAIAFETFATLKAIADVDRIRIVYSPSPSAWVEWRAAEGGLEVSHHEECPGPGRKWVITASFDAENPQAGFISVNRRGYKARAALAIVAPGVWLALLLQMALTRVQKAATTEAELVRATLRARDEERRHIARELHDDLGQSLASLKLTLKWAEDFARPKPEVNALVKELSAARDDVGAMIDKVRDLSHTLYPRILDTLGLVSAVKELGHQAARHSPVTVKCNAQGKPRLLEKDVAVALYRCCQEAINNAIRHAEASRLSIVIRFAEREVRVTVEDNGKGFDPRLLYDSNSRMMSSGFWTIRQRMADLGAAFRVGTSEGHGTVVEMVVPYLPRKVHDRGKNKTAHR